MWYLVRAKSCNICSTPRTGLPTHALPNHNCINFQCNNYVKWELSLSHSSKRKENANQHIMAHKHYNWENGFKLIFSHSILNALPLICIGTFKVHCNPYPPHFLLFAPLAIVSLFLTTWLVTLSYFKPFPWCVTVSVKLRLPRHISTTDAAGILKECLTTWEPGSGWGLWPGDYNLVWTAEGQGMGVLEEPGWGGW